MSRVPSRALAGALILIVLASLNGCGDRARALPAVPLVIGPLAVRVTYPAVGDTLTGGGRAYVFGSIGTGRATLAIDGTPVQVFPNGAFLAYLPSPTAARPYYDIVAVAGRDTVRLRHPVALRASAASSGAPATGPFRIDSLSVTPRGTVQRRAGELVRVSVRAPADARAWVELGGTRGMVPLTAGARGDEHPAASPESAGDGEDADASAPLPVWAADVRAGALARASTVVVARGADTVRVTLPAVAIASDTVVEWVALGAPRADGDAPPVVARPAAGGTYKWFLLPGTRLMVTGRTGDFVRVALRDGLEAWVAARDARALPAGSLAPDRVTANARLVAADGWVDFVLPVSEPPPLQVSEGEREVTLTLYGTTGNTDIVRYGARQGAGSDFVRVVEWAQEGNGQVRYTLRLGAPPFGYRAFWNGRAVVLRVRRPPRVNAWRPLRGLTIAVDAGHPPAGATGPTGLREPDVTLAVARRLARRLEGRGARVVLTRADGAPVPLERREAAAVAAGAHALVSIHVDAPPTGADPARASGTGTYFFHPHAEPLARAVQAGMVARMGLRDRGVYYDNLALTRPTWMPAVLCEGATLILPQHEAALRTPEFQEAYARGIADGLERYFAELSKVSKRSELSGVSRLTPR